ncbi:MAG: YggS family pyridoxal phosphate-dependent enzyme [Planctomycetes bacterium]|nr:YggS family pyridoxal phosphate-dependent enzyme [Planctomycetota bacterium]
MNRALEERLAALRARIAAAAQRAGRASGSIGLVAVTKSLAPEVASALAADLAALGVRDLGENRVQELERKAAAADETGARPTWHLIGHLQSNKARRAVALAPWIHSVDSPGLADTLDRHAAALERRPKVFLEVNVTGSDVRSGVAPNELPALVAHVRRLAHLELTGVMALGPAPDPRRNADENAARSLAAFRAVAALAAAEPGDAFAGGRARLSLGMSSDFEAAILAGSDWVRVGSALFEGVAA